jgi:hypothetical protein
MSSWQRPEQQRGLLPPSATGSSYRCDAPYLGEVPICRHRFGQHPAGKAVYPEGRPVSQPSHRLMGRRRTEMSAPHTWQTLACGYGLLWTGRTCPTGLRIRRLGVRVPPSAPLSSQLNALSLPGRSWHRCRPAASWPHQSSQQPRRGGPRSGPSRRGTRYVGACLPKRDQPNPAAKRLLAGVRTRARETACKLSSSATRPCKRRARTRSGDGCEPLAENLKLARCPHLPQFMASTPVAASPARPCGYPRRCATLMRAAGLPRTGGSRGRMNGLVCHPEAR